MTTTELIKTTLSKERVQSSGIRISDFEYSNTMDVYWDIEPLYAPGRIEKVKCKVDSISGNLGDNVFYYPQEGWELKINQPIKASNICPKNLTIEMQKKLITISF